MARPSSAQAHKRVTNREDETFSSHSDHDMRHASSLSRLPHNHLPAPPDWQSAPPMHYPSQPHNDDFFLPEVSSPWPDAHIAGGNPQRAEGRILLPMPGQAPGIIDTVPRHPPHPHASGYDSHDDDDGDFEPMEEMSEGYEAYPQPGQYTMPPSGPSRGLPPMGYGPTPMYMSHNNQMIPTGPSSSYHMQPNDHMPMGHSQFPAGPSAGPSSQLYRRAPEHDGRPSLPHRHTAIVMGTRPPPPQRQYSLQGQPSRPNPQMVPGDVFAPPGSADGFSRRGGSVPMDQRVPQNHFDYGQDASFFGHPQGISPARALGPPRSQLHHFSTLHDDPLITPQAVKNGFPDQPPSSATSVETSMSSSTLQSASSSSTVMTEVRRDHVEGSSDDENVDSPTRGPTTMRMRSMQLNEQQGQPPGAMGPGRRQAAVARPVKPPPTKPVVTGGRTSAKFSKVAEDPGVEGIPPGPRPMDRPGPSFACIIGQAILRSSAGGLSLEHIYRYVETAYPFFKTGDGAWRNSVRHNLSIHKMFETIPRTERFPPGKGGIWIIHEEEKCHWPKEDKFIKNFPPGDPHHEHCRQTKHERQKEVEAIAKAQSEGREYVPKKGKKTRKINLEEGLEMLRSFSATSEGSLVPLSMLDRRPSPMALDTTPKLIAKALHPPPLTEPEFDDDGDFLPLDCMIKDEAFEEEQQPALEASPPTPPPMYPQGTMYPPRFGVQRKERPRELDDEENVFTMPKRVRVAEPLSEIRPIPQETVDHDADSYVTPERERIAGQSKSATSSSSAFKTPALVNTSSSPGSSPMPHTIGRDSHRNPSALQQAWTTDDFPVDSPPSLAYGLDDAITIVDIKPKAFPHRRIDDEPFLPFASPRGPPKTPLTRSSAAVDRTPRPNFGRTPYAKTPMMFRGSPYLPPPSGGEMSTPNWEMRGILDRLQGGLDSPTRTGAIRSPIRSPVPPTDPSWYSVSRS